MAEDKLWPVWYVARRDEGVNIEEGFATEVDGVLLDSRGGADPMFSVFVDAYKAARALARW